MRSAQRRRWADPVQREANAERGRKQAIGRTLPKSFVEARQNIDVEERRKASARAATKTDSFRVKQREISKKRMQDPLERERLLAASAHNRTSQARRDWWSRLTPDSRAQMLARRSASQKARWAKLTPLERREKLQPAIAKGAVVSKAMWAAMSPQEKAVKLAPVWRASQVANPSSIEDVVARLLDALNIRYKRQAFIGRCLVDFFLLEKRLVIECDGTYWHSLPGRQESDQRRDSWLQSKGFKVIRLTEREIRDGDANTRLMEIA